MYVTTSEKPHSAAIKSMCGFRKTIVLSGFRSNQILNFLFTLNVVCFVVDFETFFGDILNSKTFFNWWHFFLDCDIFICDIFFLLWHFLSFHFQLETFLILWHFSICDIYNFVLIKTPTRQLRTCMVFTLPFICNSCWWWWRRYSFFDWNSKSFFRFIHLKSFLDLRTNATAANDRLIFSLLPCSQDSKK